MSDFNPAQAADAIRWQGEIYAKSKAERVYLEQFRKSKKAILFSKAPDGTVESKNSYAYSHNEYTQLLEGLRAAIEIEEKAKFQLKALELRIEIWRTECANNRKEMGAG